MSLLLALALLSAGPAYLDDPCRYDRAAMLALSLKAFDQDMTGGWRMLSLKDCTLPAADLIRDWRTAHQATDTILYWHEGQLRAEAGQYAQAIALFRRSYKPADEDAGWGWNLYVDGSIAFLRGDRPELERARAALAVLPPPPELADARGPDGKPTTIQWPMNLNVLDAFRRCWGQSYRAAYRCAPPVRVIQAK
ncbi:hypothetical protein [Sphingomonas sp. CFBP 13720]|uniref:hypothetical protein n=1 Tax=Sphingomonas sp. CFBP 13720 TaxID=2775302 RepID=UPI00177AB2E5|nr:hypothetical protein [Sphingomonas sp. CFBP 13720]MBD8678075.1 hypothetical protein [Sphingomonas sp. CFBP 13720]